MQGKSTLWLIVGLCFGIGVLILARTVLTLLGGEGLLTLAVVILVLACLAFFISLAVLSSTDEDEE